MEPERTRKRRWWLWPVGLLAGLLALVVLAVGLGAWRIQQSPVAAPAWAVERVEAEASGLLNGGRLDFRAIRLGLTPDWRPRVIVSEAQLIDPEGRELVSLREMQGVLSARALMGGEVRLTRLALSGAILRLDRRGDGTFDLGFGGGAGMESAPDLPALLAQLDQALASGPMGALDRVNADAITINYTDALSGQVWTGDGGAVELTLAEASPVIGAEVAVLTGRGELATVALDYTGVQGGGDLALRLENIDAHDLASQSPALHWLTVL
ncbi:MAG: hypothetical protein ACU0CI_13725, partial [Shimia sp.]